MILHRLYDRHYKMLLRLCAMIASLPVSAMQPAQSLISRLIHEISSSVAASSLDGLTSEPFEYYKTMKQAGIKPSHDPRIWYRGAPISLASTMPTIAIQFLTSEMLKDIIPSADFHAHLLRAFIGGAASSITATPAELIKLHVRMPATDEERKPILQTTRNLITQAGSSVLMRSITLKAMREAIFASGYLVAYPEAVAFLTQAGFSLTPAIGIAGCAAATGVTLLSQPFDTLSTRMQKDYTKAEADTCLQHALLLCQEEGFRGFYKGTRWRWASILLTMLSMGNVALYVREKDMPEAISS